MIRILLLAGVTSWVALFSTVGAGLAYRCGLPALREPHILMGILSAVTILFVHSVTLFYFIGTGSLVKQLCQEKRLDAETLAKTILFKRRVFPWATFGMVTVAATFVLGGGATSGAVSGPLHGSMGLVALLVNSVALRQEFVHIARNAALMKDVSHIAGGEPWPRSPPA